MSQTTSNNSANSTPTTTVPDTWDNIPCVQYGFPEGKGPKRAPKLCTIFEPIPEDAETASPVYILTRDQYERQQAEWRTNGYHVNGDYTSIATKLQDECEADDRVLYPIYIESDVYHEEGPETLIEWFREFVEDYLNVPFDTCRLYFSGNRSIHVHVPRFVSGEDQREQLKQLAERFCGKTGAKLDCGLYYAKRLFRLPGVKHAKTGLRKVEVESKWEHARIIREANGSHSGVPESYEKVLRRVFLRPSLIEHTAQLTDYKPHALFRVLDSDNTLLEFKTVEQEIETPLIERKSLPDDVILSDEKRWKTYNDKEFSPYALADGNDRSVAVITAVGTPFVRKDVLGGGAKPAHALIPAYFHGARGCAGEEFTKEKVHAPLQVSKRDYEKWTQREVQPGDHIAIIGGKSRRSIIHKLTRWQATVAGHALTGEDGSRQAARDFLEGEGFHTGSGGRTQPKSLTKKLAQQNRKPKSTTENTPQNTSTILPARENPQTEAEEFQLIAERDGIDNLSYPELVRVACRLLLYGWDPTWDWFEQQFGEQFDPQMTWKHLRNIVENDDWNEYDHIDVPPKP